MAAPGAMVSVRASSPCPNPRTPATQPQSERLCLLMLLCRNHKLTIKPVPSLLPCFLSMLAQMYWLLTAAGVKTTEGVACHTCKVSQGPPAPQPPPADSPGDVCNVFMDTAPPKEVMHQLTLATCMMA